MRCIFLIALSERITQQNGQVIRLLPEYHIGVQTDLAAVLLQCADQQSSDLVLSVIFSTRFRAVLQLHLRIGKRDFGSRKGLQFPRLSVKNIHRSLCILTIFRHALLV